MIKKWQIKEIITKYECIPFKVKEILLLKPNTNKEFRAYILDIPNWVNIIGIDENKNVLLITQYRFGSDTIELEIPGGVIESGETPLEAAKREFREETGYSAEKFTLIGEVNSNPAIQNNKCYTYLAENIKKTGELDLDPDEIIEPKFYNEKDVYVFLKEGKITNAYIIAAFFWYTQYKNFKL